LPIAQWLAEDDKLFEDLLRERIIQEAETLYSAKKSLVGEEVMHQFEKSVMLQTLDNLWKEHLAAMDHLRQGIHLRGYAQKNPKQEYKRESFELFTQMLETLKQEVVAILCRVQVQERDVDAIAEQRQRAEAAPRTYTHAEAAALGAEADADAEAAQPEAQTPFVRGDKVGRNDPCPCGSGKKYKHCHGQLG
jgi:preprotein translocase subunit SecA